MSKSVVCFIAVCGSPPGKKMNHAGAIIGSGGRPGRLNAGRASEPLGLGDNLLGSAAQALSGGLHRSAK